MNLSCKAYPYPFTPYPVGLPPYGGLEVRGMGYGALQVVNRTTLIKHLYQLLHNQTVEEEN